MHQTTVRQLSPRERRGATRSDTAFVCLPTLDVLKSFALRAMENATAILLVVPCPPRAPLGPSRQPLTRDRQTRPDQTSQGDPTPLRPALLGCCTALHALTCLRARAAGHKPTDGHLFSCDARLMREFTLARNEHIDDSSISRNSPGAHVTRWCRSLANMAPHRCEQEDIT